jgi:hypothetical protein
VFRVVAVRSKFKFVSTCSSGAFGFEGFMKNSVLRGIGELYSPTHVVSWFVLLGQLFDLLFAGLGNVA